MTFFSHLHQNLYLSIQISNDLFILNRPTQICLFLQSHHFGKCSHLIFLCVIGPRYNNICGDPTTPTTFTTPHPKIWGSRGPNPRIDAPESMSGEIMRAFISPSFSRNGVGLFWT